MRNRNIGWTCWVLVRLDKVEWYTYRTRELARLCQGFERSQSKHFTRVLPADKPCPFKVESKFIRHYRIIDWLRRAWRRVVRTIKTKG